MPRTNRLKRREDFKIVYSRGIRRHSSHLSLRALPPESKSKENSLKETKIGISISKKVSKKAVIRNRIKRQIRGAMRELLPTFPKGWKILIVVKSVAKECKYDNFLRELKKLLVKVKSINGH